MRTSAGLTMRPALTSKSRAACSTMGLSELWGAWAKTEANGSNKPTATNARIRLVISPAMVSPRIRRTPESECRLCDPNHKKRYKASHRNDGRIDETEHAHERVWRFDESETGVDRADSLSGLSRSRDTRILIAQSGNLA